MRNIDVYFRGDDGEILGWVTGGTADPLPGCLIACLSDVDDGFIPDPTRQKIDTQTLCLIDKSEKEIAEALKPTSVEITQLVYIELVSSDRYMVPDFPIADAMRDRWKAYRHSLRELSDLATPHAMLLAWPERPDGVDPSAALRLRALDR